MYRRLSIGSGGNVVAKRLRLVELDRGVCCAPLSAAALAEDEAAELAKVFAALGDPVRLRLLSLVAAGGEVCSCDLEAPLGKSQPTISHHTKALADAGLLVGQKRGRWMFWRVAPDRLAALRAALS
jgi:ArsR family transcriptional regulator, arsenate/arsenite/antimonite-responsive transcriptional repressor